MTKLEALAQDVRDTRAAYMRDGIKGGAAYRAYRAANATFAAALEAAQAPTSYTSPKFRADYRLEREGGRGQYGYPFVLIDAATGERVVRIHAHGGIEDAWASARMSAPVLARYGRPGLSWGTY